MRADEEPRTEQYRPKTEHRAPRTEHREPIKSYRDLRVWQEAIEFVEAIYRVTAKFPKSELYGLSSQLRRAAVSIPSNVAEGHGRESLKEYLHFLSVSQGSVAEVETQIEIASRLGYLDPEVKSNLLEQTDKLGRQLRRLRQALMRKL